MTIEIRKVENIEQVLPLDEQLAVLNLVTAMMHREDRNKKVSTAEVKAVDGIAGVEFFITNAQVCTGDENVDVSTREWVPCGLTDSEDIVDYLRWEEMRIFVDRLKPFLEVDDPAITMEKGFEAFLLEEKKKAEKESEAS